MNFEADGDAPIGWVLLISRMPDVCQGEALPQKRSKMYPIPICRIFDLSIELSSLTLYGHIKTAEQLSIMQQYGDWYTGR